MRLRKLFLSLFVASMSPAVAAMSLGEGQILSAVGEPLSVNIALVGGYSKDTRFHQVRGAECRSSIIGQSSNGCDSIYEGPLSFSIKRRADGQYFLRLTGNKSDELFYRIVVAYTSADGTVYNAFEFLPEFRATPDVQPAVVNEGEAAPATGKYGVIRGEIIEAGADEPSHESAAAKNAAVKLAPSPGKAEMSSAKKAEPVPGRSERDTKLFMKSESRLQIKKYGEYADDIHALQKENGEIESQIVLLEKHIGLLKEVIRLKGQVGASSVAETAVMAAGAGAPVAPPLHVAAPPAIMPQPLLKQVDILTWILLGAVLVLSLLLGLMYRKMKRFGSNGHEAVPHEFVPPPLSEMKPLDLTGSFAKPKW